MNYIIYLTERCNFNCRYCYENKKNRDISFENIQKIVDYAIKRNDNSNRITFYGGEPLIRKNLIKETITYINSMKKGSKFKYGITTNGSLLDDEFISYMKSNNFDSIALSIDGDSKVQNMNRMLLNGDASFDIVINNAKKLLNNIDNVVALSVITKNNIEYLDKSTKYLIDFGFKYINFLLDYSQDWNDQDLEIIRKQYEKVAKIYSEELLKENDIVISLFDEKIKTYVNNNYNCNSDCDCATKTVVIGTDGNIYPCMQFVYNDKYIIGNCNDGINTDKSTKIMKEVITENDVCKECDLSKRCKHLCPCRNYISSGKYNEVSPLICETERILIDVSDKMAEELYNKKSKLFIQRFYNKNYNLLKAYVNFKKKGGRYTWK